MRDYSDEELVDEFRDSGVISHLDELVRRHIGKVRAMVYPIVLNDADADDVTQEVFLRVVNGLAGFRKRARFSTWLYRITMNTVRSFVKKRGVSPLRHLSDPPDAADSAPGPAVRVAAGELDAQITDALAKLSPSLRSAITLTKIHGMSVRQAAEAEACLAATMYWRVHEARRVLRTKLDGQMES